MVKRETRGSVFEKFLKKLKKVVKKLKKDVDLKISLWYSCNVVERKTTMFHNNLIVKVYTKFLDISRILIKQTSYKQSVMNVLS